VFNVNERAGIWRLEMFSLALAGTLLSPMLKAASNETKFNFGKDSYAFVETNRSELKTLVDQAKSDPKILISISQKTEGLKSSSLPFIIERNRTLLIFQAFAKEGIDPKRISYDIAAYNKADPATVVQLSSGDVESTQKLVPSKVEDSGEKEFALLFPSASAVPEAYDEAKFNAFLASVGQAGRDAVLIEGYTDTVGNPKYNQALGELRALTVYEKLVRSGLPPYRVITESKGASGAKVKGDSAVDRKVLVKWQTDQKIAETAVAEDKKIVEAQAPVPPPAPVTESVVVEEVKAAPAPIPESTQTPAAQNGSTIDLLVFAGTLSPLGDYSKDAKTGVYYGLGIGKEFWSNDSREMRINLIAAATELDSKEDDRSGKVKITSFAARLDYVWKLGVVNPFVGIGTGLFIWEGDIKQDSTSLEHSGDNQDTNALVALGLDTKLMNNLFFEPSVEWLSVGGDFNSNLLAFKIALRWRL